MYTRLCNFLGPLASSICSWPFGLRPNSAVYFLRKGFLTPSLENKQRQEQISRGRQAQKVAKSRCGFLLLAIFISTHLLAVDPFVEIEEMPPLLPSLRYWSDDFQKTKKLSQIDQKPILLALINNHDCPWSEKICADILNNPLFIQPLQGKFLLVFSDTPEVFHVEKAPLLLLLNPEGEEMARVDYRPSTPSYFVTQIVELYADYQKLTSALQGDISLLEESELESFFLVAKKLVRFEDQRRILEVGLKGDRSLFFLIEQYSLLLQERRVKDKEVVFLRKKIEEKDPTNELGTHLKLALLDFEKNRSKLNKKGSLKEVIRPLIRYIEQFQDPEESWQINWLIAQFLFSRDEAARALKYAEISYLQAPEPAKPELAQTIAYLQSQI